MMKNKKYVYRLPKFPSVLLTGLIAGLFIKSGEMSYFEAVACWFFFSFNYIRVSR